ncbi:MAG: MraY family glycosyltransferase [Candidatus Ratteibacteria bacterium]|nr:MraY family glycosyltransferase [Candidatus Ratteibacteria bacterium]
MFSTYGVLLLSAAVAFLITPVSKYLAGKWKILDFPDGRKIHKTAVPRLGGMAVFLSFLLALGRVSFVSPALKGIILGALLIVLIGVIDDIVGLGAKLKLAGQILAALILIHQGVVLSFFSATFWGRLAAVTLTVIWLVGVTNGLNFLDGLDGLAAGLAAIAGLSFLLIALKTNQLFFGLASAALLGSCLGFLPYNFHPARIFLGDSGSTFLGFILAALAIMGGWAEDNPLIAIGTPLVILGIIVFDLIYITVSRIGRHKVKNFWQWIDYVGKDHFHHRLLNLGFSQRQTVCAIYSIGIYLGINGIILNGAGAQWVMPVFTQAVLMLILVTILMNVGLRRGDEL